MKRIRIRVLKKITDPFYEARVDKGEEIFHNEEYLSVWQDAEEMGLTLPIKERVDILKQLKSVQHIHWQGTDYFYNNDLDAYWEEVALLLEERMEG